MARTASILTLARKLETARAALAAAVAAKQRELNEVDAALRRVLGAGAGGGAGTPNGRARRASGRRGGRRGKRARAGGGAPSDGTLGAHVLAAQLARRMLGRPDNVRWEPPDLVALGTDELRRRLAERLRTAKGAPAL